MRAAYLDASALVKLFKPEPETEALRRALADWPVRVASELLAVEARCTARRIGQTAVLARAEAAVAGVDLLPYTPVIGERAGGSAFEPPLRALDAVHLATAMTIRDDVGIVFAYDEDLVKAAAAEGFNVNAPRPLPQRR